MKIIFTLPFIALLYLFPTAASSQSWSVGIQAGENLNTLTGDNQNDFRQGFVGGINVSHYLTRNVVLRLELNVERKGARPDLNGNPDIPDIYAATDYSFDYLTLPVLVRYTTGTKFRFLGGAGFSFNYLLRERTTYQTFEQIETDQFRRVDSDFIAVLGGGIPLGDRFTITCEARGVFGLRKVDRTAGTARDLGRHMAWGIMAGLNYYL
jgi:hypothetical protein